MGAGRLYLRSVCNNVTRSNYLFSVVFYSLLYTMERKEGSSDKVKVKVHLTGFGRFKDVDENPTTHLIHNLPSFLKSSPLPEHVTIESFTVLETSGVGSLFSLFELHQRYGLSPKTKENSQERVIWIHLGVAVGRTAFNLETTAWNEADFRCPGTLHSLWHSLSQTRENLNHSFMCQLHLKDIANSLITKGYNVVLSDDPGRFVCNWIYYNSLHMSKQNGTDSLFIHVPAFDVFPLETQLKFVRDAITVISQGV